MQFTLKANQEMLNSVCDCLVIPVFQSSTLGKSGKTANNLGNGALNNILKLNDIDGTPGQTLLSHQIPALKARRLILLGCGKRGALSGKEYSKTIKALLAVLEKTRARTVALALDELKVTGRNKEWMARQLAMHFAAHGYKYTTTKSASAKDKTFALKKVLLDFSSAPRATQRALREGKAIATGINTARELGNLPGNICTPTFLASQARSLARKAPKLSTRILNEKQMADLGMGALLSVSAGTTQPARFIIMEYKGAAASKKPLVLVGKGITFDSGGISLKPGAAMDEMKFDMCGAASVLGTMTTLTELGLPLNVVGIIASAENMPGGKATKPGDVITSMSGKTIEILNTDAEGRLVLCDALTYAQRYKPVAVIDVATLTGACIIALGHTATGLFSNDNALAEQLLAAGESIDDRAWQLPVWDDYKSQLDSNFADLANLGGRAAGSITAAVFLAQFAKEFSWAHLDIAGTAWNSGKQKGATGRPVALLSQYLLDCSAIKI
jgi:leucyl aminopeptidase